MLISTNVRVIKKGVAISLVIFSLIVHVSLFSDIESYEYNYLFELFGGFGLLLLFFIDVGVHLIVAAVLGYGFEFFNQIKFVRNLLLVVFFGASFWVLEWMFLETPLTVYIKKSLADELNIQSDIVSGPGFKSFSLYKTASSNEAKRRLQIMSKRIEVNNPTAYKEYGISSTIDEMSMRYNVDPTVVFYLNYIDSYYGEAVSGPMPFFRAMTSETFRDVVQVHLPSWFVESEYRKQLAEGTLLTLMFGEKAGSKLKYAFHKATLDVSVSPYALNTFSDVLLVLKEYQEEFPEIFVEKSVDNLTYQVRSAFLDIQKLALRTPYEHPYQIEVYGNEYYEQHRGSLKRFARAVFYKMLLDFRFATKVQVLLTKYHQDYYLAKLGEEEWGRLARGQQAAMLVMIRDLYVPNIGRLGYNMYSIPELNCTPLEYLASEAKKDVGNINSDAIWRPDSYSDLWGGAGYRLRVFNEVWQTVHAEELAGIGVTDTISEALAIIGVNN